MKCRTLTHRLLVILGSLAVVACSGSGVAPPGSSAPVEAPVSVTITSPAIGSDMETPDESVVLGGTADSDFTIVLVTWKNSRGGQGEATSGAYWKTDGIPLEPGNNTITITATDSAGGTGTTNVVIVRESTERGSTTLSWTAPTFREDGSPLTNLAGYRLKYGRLSGIYDYEIDIRNPGIVTYFVDDLNLGTWYFVASAYDSDGIESHISNEVTRNIE